MAPASLRLIECVPELLREQPERRFKARELAELVVQRYPKECADKLQRSDTIKTDADLLQQIVAEIGATRPRMQLRFPNVKNTEGRPRKYYWSDLSSEDEVVVADQEIDLAQANAPAIPVKFPPSLVDPDPQISDSTPPASYNEYDLYPIAGQFLFQMAVSTMRIDEKKGSNARGLRGNHWLYPDLVGMQDLTRGWDRELRECVSETGDARTLLWSLECKKHLNRSNVRESYFQTVSNSSWANFGYLAAAEIEGDETMRELRMLSGIHGIGIIQLDIADPSESQILIPSRERNRIDWSTCNRLVEENNDFKRFIRKVRQFYQTGDLPGQWDLVPGQTSL